MFFSVIIPLFNKEDYIARAINSVLNQTFENFEIVIIDDGSTDGGKKVVEQFSEEKVKYHFQPNSGVSSARNNGTRFAKFDYVVFLDSDDTWDRSFLEELSLLILRYPEAKLYGINQFFEYNNGEKFHIDYSKSLSGSQYGILIDYFQVFAEYGKSPFSNSSCCFHRETFIAENGYKVGVSLTEDSDLWCRFALKYKIAFCNKPLATYYIETPNNTRLQINKEGYQVVQTLLFELENGTVPLKYLNSVNKLVGYFEVSFVKRAILLGCKKLAFQNLFRNHLIKYYFLQFIFLMILLLIPYSLFNSMRSKYFQRRIK